MTAVTVHGKLANPVIARPADAAVTALLIDYDAHPALGFDATDQAEILSPLPVTVNSDGTWTVQLIANSQIQLENGAAQTAWRITETGGGASYSYPIIVPTGGPYWVGALRTVLSGTTPPATPANVAISGDLSVGGTFTLDGTAIGAPPGGSVKYLRADGTWATPAGAVGGVSSFNGMTGDVVATASTVGALAKTQNLADLSDPTAARTSLGLSAAATAAIGTASGTVAAGDDSRIVGAVQKSTLTTKGDLYVATAPGAVARIGVGADGTLPVADSTQASGIGWKVVSRDQHASKLGLMLEPFPIEAISKIAPGLGLVQGNLYGQLARPTSRLPLTHIGMWLTSAGASPAGNSYVALLSENGDQLGVSADMTSYLTDVSNEGKWIEIPLTAPTADLDPDVGYYSCVLSNLSSIPKIAGCLPSDGTFRIPTIRGHLTAWFSPGLSSVPSHVDMASVTPAVASYYIGGLPAAS